MGLLYNIETVYFPQSLMFCLHVCQLGRNAIHQKTLTFENVDSSCPVKKKQVFELVPKYENFA
jgi:hypothetical protein